MKNCDEKCMLYSFCYYRKNAIKEKFECECCGLKKDCPNFLFKPETKDINLCAICFIYKKLIKFRLDRYELLSEDCLYIKLRRNYKRIGDHEFYIFSKNIINYFKKEGLIK